MIKNRILLMLACIMMVATTVNALEKDTDDYYLLGSVQDWKDFATLVQTTPTANAKMIADIDLGDDQTHIGYSVRYCGVFDGVGHKLTINYNSSDYGLAPFRYTAGATIKNVHIDGSIISTYSPESHTSGVISHSKGADVISNVWVSVDIQSGGSGWIECAAFIGCNNSGNSTITDCLFTGKMKTTSGYYNGCFFGYSDSGTVTVSSCLSVGTFDYYGGSTYVDSYGGVFSKCYVKQFPSSIPTEMQVTDEQLANGTTVTNLNNGRTGDNAPWMQEGGQPMLKLFALQQDADDYYLLSSVSHWKQFASIVETTPTANAKMVADINLGDDQTMIGNGTTWSDYGETGILRFQGVFDGQNHTLTINYNNSTESFTAPFRHIKGATIKNLCVTGTITTNKTIAAGIAASCAGDGVNSYFQNCVSSVNIVSNYVNSGNEIYDGARTAGIVGQNFCNAIINISDCLFNGSISGEHQKVLWGGMVGLNDGTVNINNSLQIGTFDCSNVVTGSTGSGTFSTIFKTQIYITNSYYLNAIGAVQGTQATAAQLADGTTTAELNNGRTGVDAPWVQYGSTPMLKIFYIEELTANEGDAADEYWSTYYNSSANMVADANTTVYKVALAATTVTPTEIADRIITKGQAVVLKSSSANVTLTPTNDASSDSYSGNSLLGSESTVSQDGSSSYYALSKKTQGVGFYKIASGISIPAHKAYLKVVSSSSRDFYGFGDEGTTGILDVRSKTEDTHSDGLWYDINGRRVAQPTKGLYIVNGKKVIIK